MKNLLPQFACKSPESIETQVPPIESAETEPSHSIEELDEIFRDKST